VENERIQHRHELSEQWVMGESTGKQNWKPTWKDIILYLCLGILFVGQVVLCFLFYNGANLDVLLYMGWAIAVIAFFVVGGMARIAFVREGKSPEKESWLRTTVLVDTGIYAVVRHPMYLSFIMYPVALMLISQHWLSLIFGLPLIVYLYLAMKEEEKNNIEKFGDDYRRYMQRVPRVNFILGVIRLMNRRSR
jgi:protein-S-isoprenylcysteine O-methyltransferase Ste14